MTITIPTLDESVERMKQEIIDDIKAGRVPADCPSFSALHDYVDANCYRGFCEGAEIQALMDHFGGLDEEEGMPAAKQQGLPITCDVSMNHIHLSEMDIGFFDANYHLVPPLRSLRDRDQPVGLGCSRKFNSNPALLALSSSILTYSI